jgi:peptidoglycan/LPS O-acetylase OafA/YrhL
MTETPDQLGGSSTVAKHDGDGRMAYLDALRVVVIVWVVLHHAAQPYGPTGGDWPITDPGNLEWLGPLYPLGASFGLGLLFLLAGYFVPRSYDRKGARVFLRDRWLRIGLPLVVFVLLVHLPVVYLIESPRPPFGDFVGSLYDSGWLNMYLHLWFMGHLLLYSAGYVIWRRVADRYSNRPGRAWSLPNHVSIVSFVIALALVTWLVRGWYAIDEWVPLFFVLAAEPAHLPQYVSLFVIGVVAYRGDWLRRFSARTGMVWLSVGLAASTGFYTVLSLDLAWAEGWSAGGFTWRSLLFSTWEALICAGMCVGLVVAFRTVFHQTSPLLKALGAASYAAYILHVTFVVGLQAGLEEVDVSASVKFGVVAIAGLLLSFGAGHASRYVPGLRAILGTGSKEPKRDTPSQVSP